MRTFGLLSACCAALACGTGTAGHAASPATAQQGDRSVFSAAEQELLLQGATVARPLEHDSEGVRWMGGIAYQLVRARPEEVLSALESVDSLPQALPKTKSARLVGMEGGEAFIELVQGNKVADATYTIRLRRTGEDELRFWLDMSRPHDIENVWGYFRAEPFGKGQTLVTVAVALDLGPGLARLLFEDRIQHAILDTPRRIRDFIEPRTVAAY
jgi:hypothetical protein